jgi:hypothetical protein
MRQGGTWPNGEDAGIFVPDRAILLTMTLWKVYHCNDKPTAPVTDKSSIEISEQDPLTVTVDNHEPAPAREICASSENGERVIEAAFEAGPHRLWISGPGQALMGAVVVKTPGEQPAGVWIAEPGTLLPPKQ